MSGLDKYFKSKKSNPIEEEFIRQLEQTKKDSNGPDDERDKEKQKFESTINSLENENRDIKQKYERLKAKHVQLLQVLLSQEQKIQTLEARCANSNENENKLKTYSNCDLLAELVIFYFATVTIFTHYSYSDVMEIPYFCRTTLHCVKMKWKSQSC